MSSLTDLPRACLLGDARSCHVNDQYSPSQMVRMKWGAPGSPAATGVCNDGCGIRKLLIWTPWHFLSLTVFLSCPFSVRVVSRLGSCSLLRSSSMSLLSVDSLFLSVGETLRRQTFGLLSYLGILFSVTSKFKLCTFERRVVFLH